MHVEIKQNHLVIELTEAETDLLNQRATHVGQNDVCAYVKACLIAALELKGFEDNIIVSQANNFNLAKIRYISNELVRRKILSQASDLLFDNQTAEDQPVQSPPSVLDDLINDQPFNDNAPIENSSQDVAKSKLLTESDIEDDLLTELLDKDLLMGRLPTKDNKTNPKNPKIKAKSRFKPK